MSSSRSVRVLVVDDEELVRSGLSAILRSEPGIEVVASTDGVGALAAVLQHRVDVVLLDLQMPDVDGLQVLDGVRRLEAPPVVAVLTTFAADDTVVAALAAGAVGYILKDTEPSMLVNHVRDLAAGRRVLSPAVTGNVVDGFLRAHPTAEDRAALQLLSPRHRDVLALIGRGHSNTEIAEELHLSMATVKDHVGSILARLQTDSRVRAALFAVRSGLTSASEVRLRGRD